MRKKYIGVVHEGVTVPFPKPGPFAFGQKYCVLIDENSLVFYLRSDGSWKVSEELNPAKGRKFIDRGEWAEFPSNPFETRGNTQNTTPYGGCP